jgi:hypothetical protein
MDGSAKSLPTAGLVFGFKALPETDNRWPPTAMARPESRTIGTKRKIRRLRRYLVSITLLGLLDVDA